MLEDPLNPFYRPPPGGAGMAIPPGDPRPPPPQSQPTLRDPLNVQQTQGEIEDKQRKFEQSMRNDFATKPIVKNSGIIFSKAASALNQPDDAAGDLAVMYAFAQTNDPASVVRESEMALAQRTATLVDQMRAQYNMIGTEARLPKGVRPRLLESMRANVRVINDFYGAEYKEARRIAADKGFNPENITGPYLGDYYTPYEKAYIEQHGGTPKSRLHPADTAAQTKPSTDKTGPLLTGDYADKGGNLTFDLPPIGGTIKLTSGRDEPDTWVRINNADYQNQRTGEIKKDMFPSNASQKTNEEIQAEKDAAADAERAAALRKEQDDLTRKLQGGPLGSLPGGGGPGGMGPRERLFKHGFMYNLTDEAAGIGEALANPLSPLESYRAGRDVEDQRIKEARDELGWGGTALEVGGNILSLNPKALAANLSRMATVTQTAKQGGITSALAGWGEGRGAGESTQNALAYGTLGLGLGAAGGHYASGRQSQLGIDRAGAGDLARMGREQDVRISAPMLPGNQRAVNQAGRLEADTGSAETIQQGFADTASDIGRGVQRLGAGGTPADDLNLGIRTKTAIEAGDTAAKTKYTGEYAAAEAIDGDPVIEPTDIVAAIDKRIAKLERRPGANADAIAELKVQRGDLIEIDPTKPPKDLRLSEIREMRTEIRETIKGGLTRTSGQKKADKAMMEILDGVNSDIERTLSPEAWAAWKKADASFAAEATHYKEVTQKIFGDKFDELSPEDIVKRINAASKGNTQALERMVSRLSPQAQRDLAATTAHNLGKITGENGEDVFSAARFITQARQLSKHARQIHFGTQGAAAFDDLLRLGRRLEAAKGQINVSKTGRTAGGIIRQKMGQIIALALGAGGAGFVGPAAGITGLAAGGAGMVAGAVRRGMQARTLMDPKVTQILAEGARAGTLQDARRMAARLSVIVARQPVYATDLQPLIDQITALGGKGNKADLQTEDTE